MSMSPLHLHIFTLQYLHILDSIKGECVGKTTFILILILFQVRTREDCNDNCFVLVIV